MIDLLPAPLDRFPCPCGASDLAVHGFRLLGMAPFARTRCPACQRHFLAHLHVGFCDLGNFIVEETTSAVELSLLPVWYAEFLHTILVSRDWPSRPVRQQVRRPHGADVLLVNCLDPVYGHCIRRLYSIDACRQQGFTGSIVAIVPPFLEWQVPDDVDEVWVVETGLRDCYLANAELEAMANRLAASVSRLRYAPVAYAHTVDIARYQKVEPFKATQDDLVSPPRLTLNWREDRCWTVRGEASADPVTEQLRLYTLLLQTIREHAPDLDAAVTGYGRSGAFPAWVQDMRLAEHDAGTERRWAERYARSHLTLGMHGSNMNVPAALSRGAVEIVEPIHWTSIGVSWQWVNRVSAWEAVSRYRQVPLSSSVSDIVTVALQQLRRMQGAAAYELISHRKDGESAQAIAARHGAAFTQPAPVVCRDGDGRPF